MLQIQIKQEFYDKNQMPDALEMIASHIRKGATHGYNPEWRISGSDE